MAGATSVRKLSDAQLLDFERFLDAAPKYYVWGVGCLMSSIRGEQVAHNAEGLLTCKASLMGMAMRHEIKPGMNGSEFQAQFTEKLDEINQVLQDWQRRYPSASRAAARRSAVLPSLPTRSARRARRPSPATRPR